LPWPANRVEPALKIICEFTKKQWLKAPVFGFVLIGGKSSRMGKPKHEIIENGKSWLHKIIKNLLLTKEKCQKAPEWFSSF